VLHERLTRKDI